MSNGNGVIPKEPKHPGKKKKHKGGKKDSKKGGKKKR